MSFFKDCFHWIFKCFVLLLFLAGSTLKAAPFTIVSPEAKVSIVYTTDETKLDSITAHLLAQDIQQVSGYLPNVFTDLSKVKGIVILIGSIQSQLIKSLADKAFQPLAGKWECYGLKVISKPFQNIDKALVIAGSDARGTAYGVFHVSEKMGITPWYWWADAVPVKKPVISLNIEPYFSEPPSVQYRGIFINDEDWGLQPWAAKTFEPETGDIGPKTYAKVFELLLRLKANFIWPAMHPSTKAFYHYPGNVKMAELYQIVIGSSHAEPMLRNNVSEWNEKTMRHFNYLTNKEKVYQYWEERVKQSSGIKAIYSLGMRGVHDSPIEGPKTPKEAVPLIERIFADQRGLFQKYIDSDATKVPQVFTPYKEVLDIYAEGLKVPDDVTLMWPDDNYGYIQRLSNEEEAKRSGGSGVYYHASYWGRPHDYLWLSTTHPALMQEEMTKAYAMNARKIWVLNVGDIKPAEYNMQLFLDMAYRIDSFQNAAYTRRHLQQWCTSVFGAKPSIAIANMLWKYYDLAWERKPEYMGWSQTEPTTKTRYTAYNHFSFGDQAQQRIDAYDALQKLATAITTIIPSAKQAAYYQLVEYPVVGAALMNKKFLYHDKAHYYELQSRVSAAYYDSLSAQAYRQIQMATSRYNALSDGKWKGIMDSRPRKLPVFDLPVDSTPFVPVKRSWEWVVEDDSLPLSFSGEKASLPVFGSKNSRHFFDVYLTASYPVNYTITPSAPWISVSKSGGQLQNHGLKSEQRIWVTVDPLKITGNEQQGYIIAKADGLTDTIQINTQVHGKLSGNFSGYVQDRSYISINPANYSTIRNTADRQWVVLPGMQPGTDAVQAKPFSFAPTDNLADEAVIRSAPALTYRFCTYDTGTADITISTLPTHPLNSRFGMRYAISIDDEPLQVMDYRTVGRSEEWKQNVLRNAALRSTRRFLSAGSHQLKVYIIDPGVFIQNILIKFSQQPFYGTFPETLRQ